MNNANTIAAAYRYLRVLSAGGTGGCQSGSAESWLLRNGYIARMSNGHCLTTDGARALEEAASNPHLASTTAFRDEVLTGMTASGKRSKIRRGVLPAGNVSNGAARDIEDAVSAWIGLITRAERDLDMTREQVLAGHQGGWIKTCTGYRQSPQDPHFGEFRRNGERWRSVCKKCENAKGRAKKK